MSILAFFRRQLLVARVYGIPVRIELSWFIVCALSIWLVAMSLQSGPQYFSKMVLPPVEPLTAWILGVLTTAALFLSTFGHELSHALMARAEGVEMEEIVLHPFGGLARMRTQPASPRADFHIAIAGPAASFLFGALGLCAAFIASLWHFNIAVAIFFFIGCGNILLAVLNLFPGYPLDGGRVLRALLWHHSGNMAEATRMAGVCGILIAGTLTIFGIYMVVRLGALLMGLWTVLVGLFLLRIAYNIVKGARSIKAVTVGDVMGVPFTIEPDILISNLIDSVLALHRQPSFPVARSGRLYGILSLEDLKRLPRDSWHRTRARDVMRPVHPQFFVDPSATVAHADRLMQNNGVGSLAVINHAGELIGFLQRGKIKKRG
jgi:Zn-dependent protease/predicted transcriptional regulator